jgi:tetratricopeptide (TPR) repeat protein
LDWENIYLEIGILYFYHKTDFDKSLEYYKKAIEASSHYADKAKAYYHIGDLYRHSNRYDFDKAIENYKKAIELKPDYAEAYHSIGRIYTYYYFYDKHDYGKAIEYFKKAIELNSNFEEARNDLKEAELLNKTTPSP